jgi:deoxyribonuclease-1-like protein
MLVRSRSWTLAWSLALQTLLVTGCGLEHDFTEQMASDSGSRGSNSSVRTVAVPNSDETLRIAAFNIQVFGVTKMGKPHVMDVLAEVMRQFDVIAIQEIRSTDQTLMPQFLELVNSDGSQYDYVIGPRLGRTSSKEQYAYVYNTRTVDLNRDWIYTISDPNDRLHREPFVASFRARGPPPSDAFRFTLINIHTDPDEVPSELAALADVFRAVQNDGLGEDDIILLGDLNTHEHSLGELADIPHIKWAISGMTTNTRANRAYDNILFDRVATSEYTGRFGVMNLMREFNLSLEEALEVSDHYPVWAEFSIYESFEVFPVRAASGESGARR